MNPLTSLEWEYISWNTSQGLSGWVGTDARLVRLRIDGRGRCLLAAIARAYYPPYILGAADGKSISREQIISNLTDGLASQLGRPEIYTKYEGWDTLHNSAEIKKHIKDPQLTLSGPYRQFISDLLNKDIYLINSTTHDVDFGNDYTKLYLARPSVILLEHPDHYELVGLEYSYRAGRFVTYFEPDHSLIQSLNTRRLTQHPITAQELVNRIDSPRWTNGIPSTRQVLTPAEAQQRRDARDRTT